MKIITQLVVFVKALASAIYGTVIMAAPMICAVIICAVVGLTPFKGSQEALNPIGWSLAIGLALAAMFLVEQLATRLANLGLEWEFLQEMIKGNIFQREMKRLVKLLVEEQARAAEEIPKQEAKNQQFPAAASAREEAPLLRLTPEEVKMLRRAKATQYKETQPTPGPFVGTSAADELIRSQNQASPEESQKPDQVREPGPFPTFEASGEKPWVIGNQGDLYENLEESQESDSVTADEMLRILERQDVPNQPAPVKPKFRKAPKPSDVTAPPASGSTGGNPLAALQALPNGGISFMAGGAF